MATIEAKIIGRSGAPALSWELPFPAEQNLLTLRELISKVVRKEVEDFRHRQREQHLSRVLSAEELAQATLRGKIISGGQDLSQTVDEEAAVGTAWQAFEDGLYLVFVDGRQIKALDQEVALEISSHLTFIRLIALAGG